MVPERFCDCVCGVIRVFSGAFKFALAVLPGTVRGVSEVVRAVCTGTAVTLVMLGLPVANASPCSATGVRSGS